MTLPETMLNEGPGATAGTGIDLPSAAPRQRAPADAPPSRPLRIAVVTPIPTPYRDPFWSVFAGTPGIDLSVYYCAGGKPDRPWTTTWRQEFKSEVLPGRNLLAWRGADSSCYWNSGITRRLSEGRYDALLIIGYNHLTLIASILWAVRTKTPYFLTCESHQKSARSGWRRMLKRPIVEWIIRHAAGCMPTGQLAAEYLAQYGASQSQMTLFPNVPDIGRIESETARLRAADDSPVPPHLAGRPLILFVGRLIPKKRAELTIRSFGAVCDTTRAGLVIVGAGPLRPELEALVRELNLTERVHFAGFVQPEDVLTWYARASVFVLPSSETWGVVVVEALAAGVRVVVSDEAGCYPDVVTDPALGRVVPARDGVALSEAFRQALTSGPADDAFRRAWQSTAARLRYDTLATSLKQGLERCSRHDRQGLD